MRVRKLVSIDRLIAMPYSTLSTNGRITIPAEIRKGLKLQPQDILTFTIQSAGAVVIRMKERVLVKPSAAENTGAYNRIKRL